MLNMPTLSTLFNGILAGASGYALYTLSPSEQPYAFTACAFGLCHGLVGLLNDLTEPGENATKAKEITTAIMEIVPLPLVNIELYLKSDSTGLALGHGLFIIPLAIDMIIKNVFEESPEDEDNTETLKNLTILGNCFSLLFLAVNESNYLYGGMALTAFLTKYGAMWLESQREGTGENAALLGHAIFFYLTSIACGESD